MKLWILLALVSLNFACVAKVRMDIHYESLCPDSVNFITQQLAPLYEDFKRHLDITFIPFGKAHSFQLTPESRIEFTCQHGPDECFGNKVQGCMLTRLSTQDSKMAYVACQMATVNRDPQPCVEAFGISYNDILQCVDSEFATRQQLSFERLTTPLIEQTSWVPTIVYDGKLTENSITRLASPLKDILCEMTYNTNPACQTQSFF